MGDATMMRTKAVLLGVTMVLMSACAGGPTREMGLVEELLHSRLDLFQSVLDDIDYHEVQILYTQIDRDEKNLPSFLPLHKILFTLKIGTKLPNES